MFKLGSGKRYFYPVNYGMVGDGGKVDKLVFEVEFHRFKQSEVEEVLQLGNDAVSCRRIVAGWKGVQDADGGELPFSPSNLDLLLEEQGMPMAIARAWLDSLDKARIKN